MYEGIVNVLKPPGMTSSNVVSDVRKLFVTKRVGHTGTLDPGASGVLPVCIGRATRLFDILLDKQKQYIAEIAFGTSTDTLDAYGRVMSVDGLIPLASDVIDVLPEFAGKQMQIAPAYSALKHEGHTLYSIARNGGHVPERTREVEIYSLEYIKQTAHNRFLIDVCCSRGTYIRTLVEDIAARLNTNAYLSFLLRTASGGFTINEALTISELDELKANGQLSSAVTTVESAVEFLPEITISEAQCTQLINGVKQSIKGKQISDGALCRVYSNGFLGIGECSDDILKLKLNFHEV